MTIQTLRASADLRPLGSFENLFDLYNRRLPVQFSVIAELDRVVTATELAIALRSVQDAHPMLTVGVRRDADGARFWQTTALVPLVVALPGMPWDAIAMTDQTWVIDPDGAPLARCTLSTSPGASVIVMTFAHQIADGLSGTAVLRDIVRALNGRTLATRALPAAQEDLLASAVASAVDGHEIARPEEPSGSGRLTAPDDETLTRPGTIRPFDFAAPRIDSLVWSPELTRRVRSTAREHGATLHALVTAAAVRVLFATTTKTSVAVMNPMDVRRAADGDDSLALHFLSTRMGFTAGGSVDIWALARDVRRHVGAARTLPSLAAAAAGMAAATSDVTSVDDAVASMVAFANYDLMVTNLGDLGTRSAGSVGDDRSVGIADLFGPTMTTQIEGEQILALSTFDGALRTTITTRTPVRAFLRRIRDEVEAAATA